MVVTGGTGLVGRALVAALAADGHGVVVATRRPQAAAGLGAGVQALPWPAGSPAGARGEGDAAWRDALAEADAVVHLAGASIAAGRWTPERKERIRASRIESTRLVVDALAQASPRPRVLVSGSAVGYYGPRGDEELTEADGPGHDFLSEVCVAWEAEARRAEELGARVVLVRTGLVLAPDGGALPRMARPFRFFLGGPVGSGRQWISWIHRADWVELVRWIIGNDAVSGPVNATAPQPETSAAFSRELGRVLHRPARLRVPAVALRLALGEMADALLVGGQRVVPARALAMGFAFRYPALPPALSSVMG